MWIQKVNRHCCRATSVKIVKTAAAFNVLSSQRIEKITMSKGISVGLSKGHVVTARALAPRPGSRKGVRFSSLPVCLHLTHRSVVASELG